MKHFLSLLVFFVALVYITSCNRRPYANGNSCSAVATGDTVIFLNNQAVALFTDCDKDMHANVTQIMDSRCPKGVTCVWAGTVDVMLQLADGYQIKLPVGKQKDTVFNNRNYSFTLVDVVPYPGSSTDEPKSIIRIIQN